MRQDISLPQQIVQSNHAVLTLASHISISGVPNIILIGVPSEKALRKVREKLDTNAIGYQSWVEPDMDLGFTAIATEPLSREQKAALSHYRLWKPLSPDSSEKERPVVTGRPEVQFLLGAPTCAPVA